MGVWIFNGISTYIGIFSLGFNSKETIIYKAMLSFNKVCLFNSTDCMEVAFISALAHQFLYYISLLSIVNKNREKVSSNKSLNTMKGICWANLNNAHSDTKKHFLNFLIPVLHFRLDFEIWLVLYETVWYKK